MEYKMKIKLKKMKLHNTFRLARQKEDLPDQKR